MLSSRLIRVMGCIGLAALAAMAVAPRPALAAPPGCVRAAPPASSPLADMARAIIREDRHGGLTWDETETGAEVRIEIDGPAEVEPAGSEAHASLRVCAAWSASLLESDMGVAAIDFVVEGGTDSLQLGELLVTDADGRILTSRLKLDADPDGAIMRIVVESEEASFPLLAVLSLGLAPGGGSKVDASRLAPAWEADDAQADSGLAVPPGEVEPLAAPANDNCSGAIVIPNGSPQVLTTPVDVIDATTTGDPVTCLTTDRTIWYTYTAPVTGTYTITTCAAAGASGTTMPDTLLMLLASTGGCVAPGPGISCNDDDPTCSGGKQSTISASLTGGQSYLILVGRYAGVGEVPPVAGQTSIQVQITRPPANDSCAGTIPALTLDTPVSGTTLSASNDYQLSTSVPSCYTLPGPPLPVGQTVSAAAGRDTVYSFTAPAAGTYSFRVTNYSSIQNAVLYVSTTCPAGSPPVTLGIPPCVGAANRTITSGPTAEEVMCVPMSAGQTDYVIVDDAVSGNAGSGFRLEVNRCVRENEPNNTPGTAGSLACPLEGSINTAQNVDFYALGTPAAGSRVFAMSDGIAENINDQEMRVTTTTDTLEFDDDDNFTPFGPFSPNVAGSPLTGVATFLRMSPLPSASTPAEPYRLYAVVQPPSASATAETEPNGTTATASASGTDYFSGSLAGPAPSTDVDVFRFQARAGTLIMVNLDGDPVRNNTPIDPKLELLDAGGNILVSVSNGGGSASTTSGAGTLTSTTPFSPAEALNYRASTSGLYYARVTIGTSSAGTVGAGDYLLSISLDCAAGDLDADGVADSKDCAPSDASTWSLPGEAAGLALHGRSPTNLSWIAPSSTGTSSAVLYDVLRSASRTDFSGATCLQSDITGTTATDSGPAPAAGGLWSYLVRSQNACGGNLGSNSAGVPRTGRNCP